MNVQTVRLGDVAKFVRGITFKPTDVLTEDCADALGCMRTKNVQETLDEDDVWRLPKNFVSNQNQLLQEGDLLVSTANSWNLVGKACWVPKLSYASTFGGFISALRGNDDLIVRRYLYYWFTSKKVQEKLRSFGNKTTNISNLSLQRASDLQIPLPSLADQKRIAAILDKAAAIKAKREQALAAIGRLEKSLFGEIAISSSEFWNLSDIGVLQSGGTPSKSEKSYWDGNIAWISSADIVDDEIVYGRNAITQDGVDNSATSLAAKDTVLVVTRTGVGKVAITDRDTCYSQDIVAVNLKDGFCSSFVAAAIRYNKASLLRQARGATIQGITKEVLGATLIPKISYEAQLVFDKKVFAINVQRKKAIAWLAELDHLSASLQHEAFTTGFAA